jgi:CHAT domain-containing protein/tetratricopeptide (TPR) repeat protein
MARKRRLFLHRLQVLLRQALPGLLGLATAAIVGIVWPIATPSLVQSLAPATAQSPLVEPSPGRTLYEAGRYTEAVRVLQELAQQHRQQGNQIELGVTLSNLCLAYQALGAWTEAEQAIAEALPLLERQGSLLAQALDVEGKLWLTRGQTARALEIWQQSEPIYRAANNQPGVVRSRLNQAQALRIQGFYRRALALLTEVNQELAPQPDSLLKAVALRSLGDALQLVGDSEQARTTLEKSLAIAEQLQSSSDLAATWFSLGNVARAEQQPDLAITYYQRAATQAPQRLLRVQAALNHLNLLIEAEQWPQARALLAGLQTQLDQLTPSRAAVYARINLAQSLLKLHAAQTPGNNQKALDIPDMRAIAQLLATAVQQARSLTDQRAEAYALGMLGYVYEQTQQTATAQRLTEQALLLAQATNSPDIAYRWQWQQGRLLRQQGRLSDAIAAYDAAVETLKSLRSDLVAVNQDIQFTFRDSVEPVYRQSVELLLQAQEQTPSPQILDKARQRIESLQLAELDNFFREACLEGQIVPLDKVVDQDNPTAAILYPIILPDQLQVIVKVPNQPLRHYTHNVSQTEVEQTLVKLRSSLVNPAALGSMRLESRKVYDWLIRPIAADLASSGVNTLVFVLDGSLRSIPMAALYDGQKYLVETYGVALSLGLQLFDPKPLAQEQLRALTAGLTTPPKPFDNFAPLPAILSEFELIRGAGVTTKQLLDQQFTSNALEQAVNAAPYNVLHLATHGQFSSRAEDTFILAADGPINVAQFDRLLRSRDETRPEAVQLLVLSACQTAAGDSRATLGLAGVAVRAGARSTMASLWQIDDESTAFFIGEFYRSLINSKATKAEALRRAQLKLLEHPNYNSPSFWAAYVLIGNWL